MAMKEKDEPFISPSRGPLSLHAMVEDILAFVRAEPDAYYKLIVGTDSHSRNDLVFVSAVIIHRLGKGAKYYYRRRVQRKLASLRQKIFYETAVSLALADQLANRVAAVAPKGLNIEIHLDVGEHGETRDLIREVVGMVTGSGFHAEIKPNSWGASKVADRHTK